MSRLAWPKRAASAAPALVMLLGALAQVGVEPERTLALARPLTEFPDHLAGYRTSAARELSSGEQRVLGSGEYLLRTYDSGEGNFDIFIAFYGRQESGSSIHSPRNCLPGSGWEPVGHERVSTPTPYGPGRVNRYVVEHESGSRALVYYWYQGRGRVAASEYSVKIDLLRDAVFRRRTDEALVRIVFPLPRGETELAHADGDALRAVHETIRLLASHLPS